MLGLKAVTLPVVSPVTQRNADAHETLVRSSPSWSCLVHVSPPLTDTKTLPALSTVTQVALPVQVIAVRLLVPSMSCLVAVAAPLLSIARFRTLPAPSTATHDVVAAHATPLSAVDPSTSVSFHDEDSISLVLVATCTLPAPSAIAQNDEDRQNTPFMLAEPWSSSVHEVDPGFVE